MSEVPGGCPRPRAPQPLCWGLRPAALELSTVYTQLCAFRIHSAEAFCDLKRQLHREGR